ncbi:MAG: TAXI family TRAP transporter solute-binding subunit [Desulfarculaceae bacterium]|jgi:TRAP transporter TAXI family solute receptor
MKHKARLSIGKGFILAVITAALVVLAGPVGAEKKPFRIGSASMGSSGYIHWEACSYLANKYSPNLKASSTATGGSTEDVMLLDAGKIDLAHGTSLDLVAAWSGFKPFKKKIKVWQVFSWTYWALPMVALADSKINTYADLAGNPVSVVKKGSGTEAMYRIILSEYGILNKIKKNYMGFRAGINALVDGLIEATPGNFPGGKPHPIMIDLASRKKYKVLQLDLEVMKRVNQKNQGIAVVTLPKSAYQLLTKDVPSPGMTGIGLSSAKVDDELIYQFTKAVLENTQKLHSISKVSGACTLQTSTKWLVPEYPVHPGAARYFKEKGVWRDELKVGKR